MCLSIRNLYNIGFTNLKNKDHISNIAGNYTNEILEQDVWRAYGFYRIQFSDSWFNAESDSSHTFN